jgi:hypothetical protein
MSAPRAALEAEAAFQVQKRTAALEALPGGPLPGLPPETWVELARRPGVTEYLRLPPGLEEARRALADRSPAMEAAYNRLALARLVQKADPGECPLRLPRPMVTLHREQLRRILVQLDENDDDYYRLSNDDFLKDLSIVTWKLLPAGVIVLERLPRLPRRILFRGVRVLWFVVARMRGLGPVLMAHQHRLLVKRLDEEAWRLTHHRVADLLSANPALRGLAGESWQLDPQLESVSPRLAFVRRLTVDNGGTTFYTGRDARSDRLATFKSQTRRRLYEEGRYRPAVHFRLWPRQALIDWSARTREAEWGPVGVDGDVPATVDRP